MPTRAPKATRLASASRTLRRFRFAVLAGCVASSWPTFGHAETTGQKAEARAHFDRGLLLLDAGDLSAAAAEFEAAHALLPAALTAYDAALAHARSNRPLAAVRLLRDASERSPSGALRDKISSLLHEQEARLGTLLVHVSDPDGTPIKDAELHSPGYDSSELRVGQVAELSPGSLSLQIVAAGHPSIERTIEIEAGARQELAVVLERSETPRPAVTAGSVRQAPAQAEPPSSSAPPPAPLTQSTVPAGKTLPTAGIVTASFGAVIMAASGAVLWHADSSFVQLSTDVDAFNASTSPGGQCSSGSHASQCHSFSESLNERKADLERERTLAFVGLGVGATAVVAGVVWCFSDTRSHPTSSAKLPLQVVVAPSVSSLQVTGSF